MDKKSWGLFYLRSLYNTSNRLDYSLNGGVKYQRCTAYSLRQPSAWGARLVEDVAQSMPCSRGSGEFPGKKWKPTKFHGKLKQRRGSTQIKPRLIKYSGYRNQLRSTFCAPHCKNLPIQVIASHEAVFATLVSSHLISSHLTHWKSRITAPHAQNPISYNGMPHIYSLSLWRSPPRLIHPCP